MDNPKSAGAESEETEHEAPPADEPVAPYMDEEVEEDDHPTGFSYLPYLKLIGYMYDYDLDRYGNACNFDKKGNKVPMANFVAKITQEIIRDDGRDVDRSVVIEGLLAGGKPLKPAMMPVSEFLQMGWVNKVWGIQASIRPGFNRKDFIRDFIQQTGSIADRKTLYTHIGWRKLPNGEWGYLHAGGCVGSDEAEVDLEAFMERYRLPSKVKNPAKAVKASLALLDVAPREVTVPLLAYTYLAPLCEPFRRAGLEPNFLLWLHGVTGSRKTTLGLLFLAHFGAFVSKSPPASFKDTANALERKGFAVKDAILLVDDFHPESNRTEAMKIQATAEKLLRMVGDRIGRGRLTSKIEFQKEYPPRGLVLVTGEGEPGGQSSSARYLGLELAKDSVDLNLLTEAQANGQALPRTMFCYTDWLRSQMDELPDILAERFRENRTEYQKKSAHGRLGEAAAWLQAGYEVFLGALDKSMIT